MVPGLEHGAEATGKPLAETDIHYVLSNERRRLVLDLLHENPAGESTARELSEEIAAIETGENPPPRNIRQSAYVSLHQTHLPKMDEFGIIEYDKELKTVELTDRVSEVDVFMETVPKYGISWSEFYLGVAVLGILEVAATTVGVPVIASIDPLLWAVSALLLILMGSVYQTYDQGSTLLGRMRA